MPPETMHETPEPAPGYKMPYETVSEPTRPPVEPYKPNRLDRRRASARRRNVIRGRKVHSSARPDVDGTGLRVGK